MVGKFLAETISEGLVYNFLKELLNILRGIFTKELGSKTAEKVSDVIKKSIDPKGFGDEHYFALDLAEADLKEEQKKNIQQGILIAEQYDKQNCSRSARNFRIIVTFRDCEDTLPERPGKKILENIGKNCDDPQAVFAAIQIVGSMHDPAFSLDKLMHAAKTLWIPFLKAKAIAAYSVVDDKANELAAKIASEEAVERARKEEIERMRPGFAKIAAKTGLGLLKYLKN